MMNISIEQYTKRVAEEMGSDFVTDKIEKANGVVMYAIRRNVDKDKDTNMIPQVYTNSLYENGVEVEVAAENLLESYEKAERETPPDLAFLTDFDKTKAKLRARLYNAKTNVEVKKSATEYGFDDLIIVPYIENINMNDSNGSIKVTKNLVEKWGVSEEEVIKIAEENSANESIITTMAEALGFPDIPGLPTMLVLTNDSKSYGAYSIIAKRAEISNRFRENGFIVIPSSIHEVIVVENTDGVDPITAMVKEVNASEVRPEEQLSDHAYEFVA